MPRRGPLDDYNMHVTEATNDMSANEMLARVYNEALVSWRAGGIVALRLR